MILPIYIPTSPCYPSDTSSPVYPESPSDEKDPPLFQSPELDNSISEEALKAILAVADQTKN